MYSLIIIDMQEGFAASYDERVLRSVIREIRQAKRNHYPIFLVELISYIDNDEPETPTHSEILDVLIGYKHCYTVWKRTTSGCYVLTTGEKYKDDPGPAIYKITKSNRIRIVGVNTDACVRATAVDLKTYGYNVEIVADGCGSEYDHVWGLAKMQDEGCRILRMESAA